MGKLRRERRVCAPQYLSDWTGISPPRVAFDLDEVVLLLLLLVVRAPRGVVEWWGHVEAGN